MVFEPGSAVEVGTNDGDSWLSGMIISRRDSDMFLVNQNSVPLNKDMISELPDMVILHIMSFMNTKDAVQTCILSKRWKNLCKRHANLAYSFRPRHGQNVLQQQMDSFKKFASWVLSSRDDSYSVQNLNINDWTRPELLDKVIQYALIRDVQHVNVDLGSGFRPNFNSLGSVFSCRTLTSLKLYNSGVILPKSLHLPALKSLLLEDVKFNATIGGRAEPFSNCPVLDALVLRYFSLCDDVKVLCISNSALSSLTIFLRRDYDIVLSTPNLGSYTITGVGHKLVSECNIPFLREVNIKTPWSVNGAIIMQWLKVLANVKILTLSMSAFLSLRFSWKLSNSIPMSPELQPPSFVRLKSFKVGNNFYLIDEEVNTLVECLLQNSPMARVDIIVLI